MRGLTTILLLALLAGCMSNGAAPTAPAGPHARPAASTAPFHAEGARFLPPSQGQDPERTELAFPVDAPGEALVAKVHLGSRYVVELPTTTAEVTAQLVGPGNATLAKATVNGGGADATLRAASNATGMHKLVLLSYGGSDGSGMGDHVDYTIDVAAVG